jgi:deoxyribonuclease-4
MSKINGVEPCLDFAHLHARPGDGSMNTVGEWRELLESYQKALGKNSIKRLHCHLSGIEYSEKGEQNHLTISESDFDLDALYKVLVEFQAGGRILSNALWIFGLMDQNGEWIQGGLPRIPVLQDRNIAGEIYR